MYETEKLVQYNIAEDFWLQKLKGVTFNAVFGETKRIEKSTGSKSAEWTLPFTPFLVKNLEEVTGNSASKVFLVSLAALNILIFKYSGVNDILICTPGFKDDECPTPNDVLLFFRTFIEGDHIPREMLNKALDDLNDAYDHQQYEYDSFLKRFNTGDREALSAPGLAFNQLNAHSRFTEEIDLLFSIEQTVHEFVLHIKYNVHFFGRDQVERLGRHFLNVLTRMLENLDNPVHSIDILTEEEKREIFIDFAGKKVDYPPEEQTFIPVFRGQVEKSPLSTALVFEKKTLTYRELDAASNRLAGHFRKEAGIGKEDLIAFLMNRSEQMVVSILAAWKCGAAYVPVDPDFPGDRIKSIIKDSKTKLVICEPGVIAPELEEELKFMTNVFYTDRLEESLPGEDGKGLDIAPAPGNLAYVIYTSGSTGTPKGVMVEYLGMMNHLFSKLEELQIDERSVIAQNASHCFDISIWQFFAALLRGGETVIYSNATVLRPGALIKQLVQDGVNILEVVPSYLSILLDIFEEQKGGHLFPSLKYLLVTGETVKPGLVKQWFEMFPHIRMVNAYGPTEASDDITHYNMDRFPGTETIPIGSTVRNFRIYITDPWMNLCPVGVKGEICVSGIGVGRGYWNDDKKTRVAFMEDPFINETGVKMYKTGDIGSFRPDGSIEFFGRKDYQVKIRGYRIELEEIESKLSLLRGIRNAVVIEREDKSNNNYLCGYITLKDGIEKTVEDVKDDLRATLPEYMIPSNIIVLDALPLTPNGKVDRKALPEPAESDITGVEYVAPRDETETILTGIWQSVLGIEKIGIRDNFFTLGGNSLKGIRIVNKIQDWLKEVVHVTILFLAPTIEELAKKLESYRVESAAAVDAGKIEKMRKIIQPLPPLPPGRKTSTRNPPVLFILCPPRSGSTLMRVILAGHPRLFAPQEFELLTFNTLRERKAGLSGKFSFYLEGVIRAVMELKNCDADEAKEIMDELEAQDLTIREFYGVLQEWLGDRILVEKTPAYTLDLETVKRAEEYFQSALYIHLIRNPYAVIHSFENARLDQLFKYENDFSTRELAELVWLISHQNIMEFLEDVPPGRKLKIKYEDLVKDPETIVSGICSHFDLEFHSEMLRVYDNLDEKMTDGIYSESKMLGDVKFFTHSAIDTSSVEKWKLKYTTEFLGDTTVQLARSFGYFRDKFTPDYSKIEAAPPSPYYHLSPAQKRLWILEQFEGSHIAYIIPKQYVLEGNLNREAMERAYETVMKRHEILRTTFVRVEAEPRQKIHDFESIAFKLGYVDLRGREGRDETASVLARKESITPFDLETSPLLRVKLIHIDEKKYFLLFTVHHIISDGWSMHLLVRELLVLYNAYKENNENPLPPLRLQYKDYSEWQNSEFRREALKRQEAFWLEEFAGDIPVLNLPSDYPRPAVQNYEGNLTAFELCEVETQALNTIARAEGATLFMVILAVLNVFLSKISGREDIVVGTPTAGRRHADMENILGLFINTLALRNRPSPDSEFTGFLREVKENSLKAFENQDYQFEELVDRVAVNRDISRNPLFDVMFMFQDVYDVSENMAPEEIAGLTIKNRAQKNRPAKFDLTVSAVEKGKKLHFLLGYCTKLFREETIARFVSWFRAIVSSLAADPGRRVSGIDMMSEEEKNRVLVDFNRTGTEFPEGTSIHQLFEAQVERTPEENALVGVSYEGVRSSLTYRQLNEASERLAGFMRKKGITSNTVTAVMVDRSLELMIGILGIMKAGGAYLPIDTAYPTERVKYILGDSGASFIFADSDNNNLPNCGCEILDVGQCRFTGETGGGPGEHTEPGDLLYVIYTSGSTGKPKGVMVEHRPMANFIIGITGIIDFKTTDNVLSLTTVSFDIFGLETLLPLTRGATVVIGTGEEQLNVESAARVMIEENITILQLTPSRLSMFLDSESVSACLASLDYLLVGGEALPETLLAKAREVRDGKIYNLFGPTETTIWSTVKDVSAGESLNIGKPIANTRIYILGKNDSLQPPGIVGELCIAGAGLSRGYINNVPLTHRKFAANPYEKSERLYRTGDLARWLPDGNIEFSGRIDHQVKIRGFRIELEEIEGQLVKHPGILAAVTTARSDEDGVKYLCAYIVPAGDNEEIPGVPQLGEFLAQTLPPYMIPSYFTRIDSIPLTPSGKIDRKALPEPEITESDRYTPPGNRAEEKMVDIWSDILGVEKKRIGVDANFFQLGGHSLKATVMLARVNKELKTNLSLTDVFKTPTIRGLAGRAGTLTGDIFASVEPAEEKAYYPLAPVQKRLFTLHRMDDTETGYNMSQVVEIEGEIHRGRLADAFRKLIRRHESLGASFEIVGGEPVYTLHPEVEFDIEYHDSRDMDPDIVQVIDNFSRPFDLSKPPLLRVGLVKTGESRHLLIADIHHIITDGISMDLLIKDFIALYAGKELPPLRFRYRDYSEWQNSPGLRLALKEQEAFWLNEFKGGAPVARIPADYPGPAKRSFECGSVFFEIDSGETQQLNRFVLKQDVTLFMFLLAIYNVFLSKICRLEDVTVGIGIAGRRHEEFRDIVGMFVNTLALRNYPAKEKKFDRFLAEVKERTLQAYENQDYPFDNLAEKVVPDRNWNRNPLFDTVFVMQNQRDATGDGTRVELPGLTFKPYRYKKKTAMFDISLFCTEGEDKLLFRFDYAAELFKPETVERFAGYFKEIVSCLLHDNNIDLKDIVISHNLSDVGIINPEMELEF